MQISNSSNSNMNKSFRDSSTTNGRRASFRMGLTAALAAAVLSTVSVVHAGPPIASMTALENMTWMELKDQIRNGKTTVVVPIGGTEQNGPFMTLGKHNVRVNVLAR